MRYFIVSFTISTQDNYQEVWQSLADEIKLLSVGNYSDETTSFFAFKADMTVSNVLHRLYCNTQINAQRDKLIVVDITNNEHAYIGITYPTILSNALGTTQVKVIPSS
ncbi:MAG: hypothetical protein GYB28_01595 [Gammaproteobacteria bacterium]|uniref:Uncharacterized protein n=1 Tax=Vreelandella venusta TaxID=44935 RepID=A0ABX2BD78_9GAMM|nr:hypothetical protein [Halomonas venusta]AZM95870.1 hypothetical protein EI420_09310 [Halomonas venusta]MBR9923668.1 hypothetical protein [Gammaproteobacteria bacterium]NPT30851.1 hypothetical protein [Halomonas venusta]